MNHLMIDLETMGNKPTAPVISIGAIFFEPSTGEMGPEFYTVVKLKSSIESGAIPDPDTIIWWMKQSAEARIAICDEANSVTIGNALLEFNNFIIGNANPKYLQVWGNGATFDNVILRASYERDNIDCLWPFWGDRDVRTIVELGRAVGFNPRYEIPFEGDMHNALADAKHQAKYVSAIWQKLVPATSPDI